MFISDASSVVDVEVPDDFDVNDEGQREAAFDKASEDLDTGLCNQCARHVGLGDFRPYLITNDTTGDEMWQDESAI